jgi:hypothetical protein
MRTTLALFLLFATPVVFATACSESNPTTSSPVGSGGASGSAGAGAGTGGQGVGGSASGGTGGVSGAGASGAGAAGGSGGYHNSPIGGHCRGDEDCAAVTNSTPANCAEAFCAGDFCRARSRDGDGDGVRAKSCTLPGSVSVQLGTDCDDTDPTISPDGWDGPADGAKPDACGDGVDQDCSGTADDGKTTSGATCTCIPGDVRACSEEDGGKPILWPSLGVDGKPIGSCKPGSQTCLTNGTFGPCTGAIVPRVEECNDLDDDCDGQVDEGPPSDAIEWVYDGDGDKYAAADVAPVVACGSSVPSSAAPWTSACPDCLPSGWVKGSSIDKLDCNDAAPAVHPGADDVCGDDIDSDCDGSKLDGCACVADEACVTALTACPGKAACTDGKVGPCNPIGPCECANGATSSCQDDKACNGTKTCANNVFGACIKTGSCIPGETTACQVSNDFAGKRGCVANTCAPDGCALDAAVGANGVAACTTLPKAPPATGTCDRHAYTTHLLPGTYKLDVTVMHQPNGAMWSFEKPVSITRADGSDAYQNTVLSGLLDKDLLTYEAHPQLTLTDDLPGAFVGYGSCGSCVVDGFYVEMKLTCLSGGCTAGTVY